MSTRIIDSEQDRSSAIKWLENHALPCTLNITKGRNRTNEQNRLQRLWMNEIAEQLGEDTAEYYRGFCKLNFGLKILCSESDEYRETYDKLMRPHGYEWNLAMMQIPADYAVTRLMTTKQKSEYLDAVWHHFTDNRGVKLTEPNHG